jgi:hypothetical protein
MCINGRREWYAERERERKGAPHSPTSTLRPVSVKMALQWRYNCVKMALISVKTARISVNIAFIGVKTAFKCLAFYCLEPGLLQSRFQLRDMHCSWER